MALTYLRLFVSHSLLVILLVSSYCVQARELKAVYAQGYLPFSWIDEQGTARGVEVDFVQAVISKRLGLKVNHAILPWARGQSMVEEGQADIFVTIPNKKRRAYALVSDLPLFSSNFLMYTGASNPKINTLKAITNLQNLITKKNIIHGHIVGAGWHATRLKNVEFLQVAPSSLQILQLLDKNRIDVYIEQAPLIAYQIKTLGFESRITEIPQVLEETHWHICLSKKSQFVNIMPRLNKLLKDMKNTGALTQLQKEIFSQYR